MARLACTFDEDLFFLLMYPYKLVTLLTASVVSWWPIRYLKY